MVNTLMTAFALFVLVLFTYVLYERWRYEQDEKKRLKQKGPKPKAMRKMEYDCTDNFYDY